MVPWTNVLRPRVIGVRCVHILTSENGVPINVILRPVLCTACPKFEAGQDIRVLERTTLANRLREGEGAGVQNTIISMGRNDLLVESWCAGVHTASPMAFIASPMRKAEMMSFPHFTHTGERRQNG